MQTANTLSNLTVGRRPSFSSVFRRRAPSKVNLLDRLGPSGAWLQDGLTKSKKIQNLLKNEINEKYKSYEKYEFYTLSHVERFQFFR